LGRVAIYLSAGPQRAIDASLGGRNENRAGALAHLIALASWGEGQSAATTAKTSGSWKSTSD
jgi:hypothetical protein